MIRILVYLALGAFLMLLWQDPDNAFFELENLYENIKTLVVHGVQWLKSGM
jgi:hypothetical protein